MVDLKVLEFKNPQETEDPARLPNEEELKDLLCDVGLKACFLITLSDEGVISHYMDHLTDPEAFWLMEVVKHVMITRGNLLED
jgi:hypothetical protein